MITVFPIINTKIKNSKLHIGFQLLVSFIITPFGIKQICTTEMKYIINIIIITRKLTIFSDFVRVKMKRNKKIKDNNRKEIVI